MRGSTRDTNNTAGQPSRRLFRNKDCMECELNADYNGNKKDIESTCYNPFMEDKNLRFVKTINDVFLDGTEFNNETVMEFENSMSYDDMFDNLVKSFQKSSIPDSISMLINYGTEGSHILYDASHVNHDCSQVQIWDPFSEICRDVYCAANLDVYIHCRGGGDARLVYFDL